MPSTQHTPLFSHSHLIMSYISTTYVQLNYQPPMGDDVITLYTILIELNQNENENERNNQSITTLTFQVSIKYQFSIHFIISYQHYVLMI